MGHNVILFLHFGYLGGPGAFNGNKSCFQAILSPILLFFHRMQGYKNLIIEHTPPPVIHTREIM